MQWFLYIIGALWIAFGCCSILYTNETRDLLRTYLLSSNTKIMAAIALLFGLLLIAGGSASNHAWFIRIIGLIVIGKGALIYFNPDNRWTRIAEAYVNTVSEQTHRLMGIFALILGTALFSWII